MFTRWFRSGCLAMLVLMPPGVYAQPDVGDNLPAAQVEVPSSTQSLAPETAPETDESERKAKGKSLFWIVLVISLLFVVGSASALNAMGGKQPQQRKADQEKK